MTRISTHVLDTARGIPAEGVSVRLERQESSSQWRAVGSAQTDSEGRCSQLLRDGEALAPGIYRLAFDTGAYFKGQGSKGLYPVVQITFEARQGDSHFHIPLLLSPNGYTTYRGS